MTAVGYTGGDPEKVSRSGDTMSGDLDINANLQVEDADVNDDLNVDGDVTVGGGTTIAGGASVGTNLQVVGNTTIGGNAGIAGTATVTGGVNVGTTLQVTGNASIGGNAGITGSAAIAGGASVGTDLQVIGDTNTGGDANTTGDANVGGDVNITSGGSANVTGGVNVGTDLQVDDDANVDGNLTLTISGSSFDVGQAIIASQSTSVLSGGELSINADPTRVNIAALTGIVVDYDSSAAISPTNPSMTFVNYAGVTGLAPANVPFSYYLLNSAGVLSQQATRPTATQRRQSILLGLSFVLAGTVILVETLPVIPSQLGNQMVDLMEGMGSFSVSGNVLSANGANLSFNKSVGTMFARAFTQDSNYLNPHNSTLAAQTPMSTEHVTALVGSAGPTTTFLNVGFYDPGGLGVVTPVGGGANTSTNFRVYGFATSAVTEQAIIQYGQNTYASLATAVANISTGSYIQNPTTLSGALLGWISVVRTATDLSNAAQAVFTKASKFATP